MATGSFPRTGLLPDRCFPEPDLFGPVSRDVFDKRMSQGFRLILFGHEFRLVVTAGQQLLASLGR